MKEYGKRGIALLGTMLMIGICMRGSMGRLTALAARMPMVSFWQETVIKNPAASMTEAGSASEAGSSPEAGSASEAGSSSEDGTVGTGTAGSALSGTGSWFSAGRFWYRTAFPALSRFLEKQETVLAQTDPAYEEMKKEQELYRNSVLAAQAGAETVKTGAGTVQDGAETIQDRAETIQAETETVQAGVNAGSNSDEAEQGTGETDMAAPEESAASGEPGSESEPVMAAKEVTGTVYTMEELADFEFMKKKFFYVHKSTTVYPEQLDASVLLGKDMTLPETDEVQLLLFHTHGSEAFADSVKGDESMTVVGIGNYLAELLSTQYGIQVLHNTEVFPYSDSYSMAASMLKETLAEHPSIQVTIDLHRDSGGHEVVDINGKPTAPIMFFNGMCQTPDGPLEGVSNPYLLDNLAFNFQLKLKAEAYYPGFTLRTFLKAYRYNQHVLPRATLIEVGTEENTFEEARNAMEPLADLLYKVLRDK